MFTSMAKRLPILAAAIALTGLAHLASASAEATSASTTVRSFATDTVNVLRMPDLAPGKRQALLGDVFDAHLDVTAMGRYVIGKHWDTATADQQASYEALFGIYVLHTYTRLLGGYQGERIVVLGERTLDATDTLVDTEIMGGDGGALLAALRVRDTAVGPRIIDVLVSGVSLTMTHKAQFIAIIKRSGIAGLLEALEDHAMRLAAREN